MLIHCKTCKRRNINTVDKLVCGRLTFAFGSALVHPPKQSQQKHHTTKRSKHSITQNIYFHLFSIFLLLTRAVFGRPAKKLLCGERRGLQLFCGRLILALSSALVPQILSCLVCMEDSYLISA